MPKIVVSCSLDAEDLTSALQENLIFVVINTRDLTPRLFLQTILTKMPTIVTTLIIYLQMTAQNVDRRYTKY